MPLLRLTCPTCQFPRLNDRRGVTEQQFAGEFVRIKGLEFMECPRCRHRFTTALQDRRNLARTAEARLDALASKWEITRPPIRA